VLASLVLAIAVVFALAQALRRYGDPAPAAGIVVNNQTDLRLRIFVSGGDSFALASVVLAHARQATGIQCGRAPMIAKDDAGHVVARRAGSASCNEAEWTIGALDVGPSAGSDTTT
jgi:hypothetical protein